MAIPVEFGKSHNLYPRCPMFVYYGKQFQAESAGALVVGVDCEKCACRYYYELARIGTGMGVAHYGIGAGRAQRTAASASERDLQKRLESEAELVPCPNCNWISHELVRGYRRTRYRPLLKLALGTGFFGVVISLISAWYLQGTFGGDRIRPYVLYGGPALFIALAIGILILQWGLRSLIRPNRNHPHPPNLPPGTPPALLLDEETDELQQAKPRRTSASDEPDWLDIQVGRHVFPMICCGCLQPATTEHAAVVTILWRENGLEVPQCASCAAKTGSGPNATILAVIALFVAVGTGSFWVLEGTMLSMFVIGLLVLMFNVVAIMAQFLAPRGPAYVLTSDSARGVVRLRFRNPEYARVLAEYLSGKRKAKPRRDDTDAFTAGEAG